MLKALLENVDCVSNFADVTTFTPDISENMKVLTASTNKV